VGILFVLPCLYGTYKFGYHFLAYLAIVPFCLYDINVNRVLKAFTVTVGLLLASAILCSLTGIIPANVQASTGTSHVGNIRGGYGIISSTDLAAYFVFLLLAFWCCREKKKDGWNTLLTFCLVLLTAAGIYISTSAWTSILLCLLLALGVLYEHFEERALRAGKEHRRISGVVDCAVTWIFPVLAVLFYGLTRLYGQGNLFAIKADQLLHSRLKYAWLSAVRYGVHPLGALTPQNGNGGLMIRSWQGTYDFLDSTYGLLLIRYGWVLTLMIAFLWVWMTRRALKHGKRRIACSMAIIAVHCFSEHHFPELNYNIFLAMPLCAMIPAGREEADSGKEAHAWLPLLTGGLIAGGILLTFPGFLSRTRALFELKGWLGGAYSSSAAWAFILLCLILIALLWRCVTGLAAAMIEKRKAGIRLIAGILVPVLAFAGIHLWTGRVLDTTEYDERIRADTPAVERILSAAEEPVYTSQLEEIYKRNFQGISDRIGPLETLGGEKKGTAIAERDLERYMLLHTGAVYAEISDYSAVYTYDDAVIQALRSDGYDVRGYYYSERELDLRRIAAMNGVEADPAGTVHLEPGENLVEEPDLSLYSGTYLVTFDLTAEPEDLSGDICDLEITTYNREILVKKVTVTEEDFDGNGRLHEEISCTIKNAGSGAGSAGVGFNVYPRTPVTVNRISWKQIRANDRSRTYDSYNRLITAYYVDADGNPEAQSGGYYGVAYEYGSGTAWTVRKYLDEQGNLMTGASGYAQTVRARNEKGQLIEERYLDEQGELCLNASGYAMYRMSYDEAGNANDYRYFGTDEEPILINSGYAELRRTYNDQKQITEESYYGTEGVPALRTAGYAAVRREYDQDGNVTAERYYGVDGEPVLRSSGYAEVRRVYNENRQKIREEYYGTDGNPIALKGGRYATEYSYYASGKVRTETYLGLDGETVRIIEHQDE
jgi:hypothetical protein